MITVASPPAKPLMVYDGDCNFCKFWILRFRQATRDCVDYVAYQDPLVAGQFPEVPRENFARAVHFIERDGKVYRAAEAVFRAWVYTRMAAVPLWLYQNVPGVAAISEWCYKNVAERRTFFSKLTQILIGSAGMAPEYQLVRVVFLRLLGLIYLCAFLSLGAQIIGLMGEHGVSPAADRMHAAQRLFQQAGIGTDRYHLMPTLCWLNSSDAFLKFLCVAGCALSALLVIGFAPALCLILLWIIYLSLTTVGSVFLAFQWDALLLETGFLAIFFAPLRWRLVWGRTGEPSRLVLWLLRWLLFRLMFESGIVKLLSGDPTWTHLTALDFHYETQPLPTWIGWYAHQLPAIFQKASVVGMFIIELAVPFLIFAPRRLRFFGCFWLVLLQVVILLTGNYCFFNLLTIALCLLILDDAALTSFIPRRWRSRRAGTPLAAATKTAPETCSFSLPTIMISPEPDSPRVPERRWPLPVLIPLAAFVLLISGTQFLGTAHLIKRPPAALVALENWVAPFESINSYGLFRVMTTSRVELEIQGSADGRNWLTYEFKYKPGDPRKAPGFVAPHQPRLDWQMWFAALENYRDNPWLLKLCVRLRQESPAVLALLANNPFPKSPPNWFRVRAYEYHFSNSAERRAQGIWWRRKYVGEYLPALQLDGRAE